MDIRGLAVFELDKLASKSRKGLNETDRARARARTAKNCALQRRDAAPVTSLIGAEPGEWMLQQREQLHRLQPPRRSFGDETGEDAGRSLSKWIAPRIIC